MRRILPMAFATMCGLAAPAYATDAAALKAAFEKSKATKKPLLVVVGDHG